MPEDPFTQAKSNAVDEIIVQEETTRHDEETPDKQQSLEEPHVTAKSRKIVLNKYTIYVTNHRMYIVGSNSRETVFRILEIDMDASLDNLVIMEDNVYFKRNEIMDVLNGLEESSEGGLTKKLTGVGLLGFTKFTKWYYLVVVTKKRTVAVLGSHAIYHIDETEMIPVTHNYKTPDRNSDEARYVQTFMNIDLNKTFYYSDSYDITNTLQCNILRNKAQANGLNGNKDLTKTFYYNERFVWNNALLLPILKSFDKIYDWFQPIIHGFVDQVQISIFQTQVYVTLIARRSHHFAGARFFKRGVNEHGDVANEVETEQIVADMLTSPFHDPAGGFYNNPRYTSFVQHRGSIPLSWSQTTAPNLRIKPPIEFDMMNPYYPEAALHFDNMFERYGTPVQILNLIKQREKTPRETKLFEALNDCIDYLNQFLPEHSKLDYTSWDMSRASKARGQDVIEWLEKYSESTVNETGIFHNGQTIADTRLQQGICRTNCVDCLDRTNTAQFVIGKRALGHQLHALGIIDNKYLEYDSDVTNILTEMFHDHGDTIALQYGGSHLVNTLQTYRKINQWTSHSRDMIESVKRFYSNSMVDAQKQEAMNLFLGNYKPEKGKPQLWELNSDYYLHNSGFKKPINYTPSYTQWFTEANIQDQKKLLMEKWNYLRPSKFWRYLQDSKLVIEKVDPYPGFIENYWIMKYSVKELAQFTDLFEFTMNSTSNYNNNSSKILNNSVVGGVVNKMGSNNNYRMSNESKGFTLFNMFNEKRKCDSDDCSTYHLAKSEADLSRRSSSVFGMLSTLNQPDSCNYIMENVEKEEWFSPFKSRKPHRELQLMTNLQYSYDKSIKTSSDDLLDGIKEIIHSGDELHTKNYLNQWEDEVIAVAVLQLDVQKNLTSCFDDVTNANRVRVINPIDQTLPIIDQEKLSKVQKEVRNQYKVLSQDVSQDEIVETREHFKAEVDDFKEKKKELSNLYTSLSQEYTANLPEVSRGDVKIYERSLDVKFNGLSDTLEVPQKNKFHNVDDSVTVDFNTVIFKESHEVPIRRAQSATVPVNGLVEIRNQWKLRRKEQFEKMNESKRSLNAICESTPFREKFYSVKEQGTDDHNDDAIESLHSEGEAENLGQLYEHLLEPTIKDSDIELYRSMSNYNISSINTDEKAGIHIGFKNSGHNEKDAHISTLANRTQKKYRSQTTGAIGFLSIVNKNQSGDVVNGNYGLPLLNAKLKKKLSKYNIRGL